VGPAARTLLKLAPVAIVLTVVTQIGGVAVVAGALAARRFRRSAWAGALAAYAIAWLFAIPLARLAGRVPLPLRASAELPLAPLNVLTCVLNRHYARASVRDLVVRAAHGRTLYYLDAGFPFGGPLFPHLSHGDGRKIDLAFFYRDAKTGAVLDARDVLFVAYGASSPPAPGEIDQPAICAAEGHRLYGLLTTLAPARGDLVVDAVATAALVRALATDPASEKVFLEPHLRARWGLEGVGTLRYHGCHAVRHDDHVHVQSR